MNWQQVIDPFKNIYLSVMVALLPVLLIFWSLIIKKLKGYQAALLSTALAFLIALFVYGMPVKIALLSTLNGALYGLFPICWIILPAVFLFNITVKSGQFEIIRHSMASITNDRRLQALLIAFSFGSFLEGTAGFGAPVAITAAMLTGLGFNPLYAAGLCLIANTAPVAFGSIGIPITVASQVSGIPEMAISQMVGRTLPFLSLLIPFYLVSLMSGLKRSMEVLPAILVSGISFAFLQWLSSNYLGPSLPDVFAGLGSIISLVLFLKWWKPKNSWRFKEESAPVIQTASYSNRQVLRAWSPFIMLTVMVIAWGLPPVKELFNAIGQAQLPIPGLHLAILDVKGIPIPHIFKFNYLSAAGTAIFISALLSLPLVGLRLGEGVSVFIETLKQLRYPILTITSMLSFAFIANDSGITLTIAGTLAATGVLFPFFSPLLGWLGVFITGSDTSANALFGKLQFATAQSIGVDPVVTVSANVSGGVMGKMISPQSIAVAAAAGGLVGKESSLFRFTVKHSFVMLLIVSVIVLAQAYWLKWMTPVYRLTETKTISAPANHSAGLVYLLILLLLVTAFTIVVIMGNRRTLTGISTIKKEKEI